MNVSSHPLADPATASELQPTREARRFALGYGIIASLWILLTDASLANFTEYGLWRFALHSGKGLGFVAATAVLLYVVLRYRFAILAAAEAKLRQAERRCRHLASFPAHNPNPVIELDRRGEISFANHAAVRLAQECGQADVRALLPADIGALSVELLAHDKRTIQRTIEIQGRWFDWVIDVDAEWDAIRLYGRDVTERCRSEAALRRAAAELRSVLDSMETCAGLMTLDGCLIEVDSSSLVVAGLTREQVIGLPLWQTPWFCYDVDIADKIQDACRRAARGDRTRFDVAGMVGYGRQLVIDLTISPVVDDQGQVVRIIASGIDITDRLAAEASVRESEARLRSMLDHLSAYVAVLNRGGCIVDMNRAAMLSTGVELEQVVGRPFVAAPWFAGLPESAGQSQAAVEQAAAGQTVQLLLNVHTPQGLRTFEATFGPLIDAAGQVSGVLTSAIDITEKVAAERELVAQQEQVVLQGAALSAAANAIFITDGNGRIVWVNESFCEISGYSREELIGQTPALMYSGRHDERFYGELWSTIQAGRTWRSEVIERRKNGEEYCVQETITPIRTATGEVSHFVAILEDITERKRAEQLIAFQAFHDVLTELPNRKAFQERLADEMQRSQEEGRLLAVHFVDLDHFKFVNDTLGHATGDDLLREVAHRIKSVLRPTDFVARLGGDEFAVLQRDLQRPQWAASLATQIMHAIAEPWRHEGHDIQVSASVGIAVFPIDCRLPEPDELLRNADVAMYHAKREGRSNFQFFTESLNAEVRNRMQVEHDLRRAIAQEEFVLHYQPEIDLASGRIVGLEALVRWQHPERGLVYPGEFISIAEESGLIGGVTDWVLREACRQNKAWQDAGFEPVRVAVNVSAANFRGRLEQCVESALYESGLEARWLEIEVTESMLLSQRERVKTLERLSERGVKIAIDDFGTGYSSLSCLRNLKACKLKMDRSFTSGLPHQHDDVMLARAIIDLGHSLEMVVLAEGIETEEQRQFLAELGCELGQGYHFHRPLPAARVETVLTPRPWPKAEKPAPRCSTVNA